MNGGSPIKLLQAPNPEPTPWQEHWLFRYGLAILLVAATIGLSLVLTRLGIKLNFTIPVVLALVAAAWYGGRGPGLLVGVLFQATTIIYAKIPDDTTMAAAIFGYFSTFCLYVFMAVLISGLRNILRRLSEQRDLLKVTLSSIGDAVIATDKTGQVTFMNSMAEQLTGWDESGAQGRQLTDVFHTVDEESGRVISNPVELVLETGTVAGLANHTKLISRSGKQIPIDNSAAPIKHDREIKGVVLVFSDVTERKLAGAVSAKLASIVESSSDAIISKDLNGIITSWNMGAEQIFGYTAEEVVGKSVTILMPPDRVDEEPAILESIRRGEGIDHYETIRQHKDGRLLDISLNVSPVYDSQGKVIGASKIARDMTQRKLAESAIRERETMQRIVEAQEAERHRIARDLHDHLGQKMTALRLRIQGLTESKTDDRALDQAIGEVQESASYIDRDIGFLSWELRPTELENLGLINALRSFVREWSGQYGITAEFHSTTTDPVNEILLDKNIETNLYRIVQEALNNVLKHAQARNVNVLLHQRDNHIILVVEDDGLGFERENNSGDLTKRGGLGLVGMHERAALLRGSLEIDTWPGVGTTILATIPVASKTTDRR